MHPALARTLHRGLTIAHRNVRRLDQLLTEVAVALCPPGFERIASDAHYAATTIYRQPENQRSGLFPFEARALAAWFPEPPARLLLPGAGGGRELLALVARGYSVDALEPVPALAGAARRALAERGALAASVVQSSLESWAETAVETAPYDGVFTGWATWTHLIRRQDRLLALRAFRRVCPRGPVLLSFWRREAVFEPSERTGAEEDADAEERSALAGRVRTFTRTMVRQRLLGLPPVEPGTTWSAGLYAHRVSEAELSREAAACGYRLVHYERDGSRFPNAVLLPQPALDSDPAPDAAPALDSNRR